MLPDSRQAGDFTIEVTPEMIEAGVFAASEHALGLSLTDLVHSVYVAMEVERQASAFASSTMRSK